MPENYKVISLIEQYDKNKCDILIPCRIIYGFIPVMPTTSIIFEETILKLTAIGINSPEYIAAILCLDEEFVSYILNILLESNLIDKNYKITETGKSCINKYENTEENKQNIDDVEYILVGFIQNMLDGKLCDYIAGEKLETYICSNKEIYKKNKRFKIEHIRDKKSEFNIDEYKYKHIISINKKYHSEIPVLGNLDIDKLQAVPKNYDVDIDKKSVEEVYLHCQVEYINNQICVTDGYGSIAEDYIRSLDYVWLKDFINKQSISESSTQLIKFKKYSNIEKYIIKINEYGSSETDNKKLFDGLYYKHIYSLMENVLYRILKDNNFNKSIKNYTSDDIKSKCSKIGFKVPEKYKFKCNQINSNNASFDKLISHIILLVEDTDNKRIRELVKEYPDFILQMCELKKYRDNEAHGKKSKENISANLEKFIKKENIFDIIKLLLPDLEVNDKEGSSIIKIDDKLKNAIIDVRLQLGNNLYERLPENICDNLINAFLDSEDAINNIYSTYQQMLVYIISNYNLSSDNIVKKQVLEQFNKIADDYINILNDTSDNHIINAANNSNSTLNGCLIVFMYMKKYEKISKFFDKNPDFINDVASIISKRKHGNTLGIDKDIEDKRNKLLKYIKYFMGELYV